MATHTTYYNLTKPAQNDKVNIGVLNDNADIIDTALHNKVNSDDLTANNVMMSDGVTSVEDALNSLIEVNKSISALACSTAWGSGYMSAVQNIDISALGLQNTPSVVGVAYTTTNNADAFPYVESVSNTIIKVGFMRLTSTTNLTGELGMIIRSNG